MIGKCCGCKIEIEIIGSTRFCADCKKIKNTAKWKLWNDKRPSVDKTEYKCTMCKNVFYSKSKRKYQICNDSKCRGHFYNLRHRIVTLKQNMESIQETLTAKETEYKSFLIVEIEN